MMQEKSRLIITMTTTELLFLVKFNTRGPNVTNSQEKLSSITK